jgi:hypothetical protein
MHERTPFLFALLTPALLLLGLAGLSTPAFARGEKVEICHIPPDDPENAHTIHVSENPLPAHLAHGDFAVGEACSEGVGECRAEGTTQCDVADTCSAVPGAPSDEICDGLDNDCDGVVDNDPIDLGECTAGVGECAVDGDTICTNGVIECDAVADDPLEDPETSCDDGRDNDCDGLIDTQDDDCPVCPCVDTWENSDATGARPLSQSALTECTDEDSPSYSFHQLAGSDESLHQYIVRVEYRSNRERIVICVDDIPGDLDTDRSTHSFDTEVEAAAALEVCRPVLNDAGCDL